MSTLITSMSDDQMHKPEDVSRRPGVAPEELLRASIEELLAQPDEAFRQALDFVLSKNAELYKRLA
jgi:hypothetical protein